MTSLFTRFVARGVEVPVSDPMMLAHFEASEVVTADEGQAAIAETDVLAAADKEQPSS
jgi:hypothetical protein